VPDGDVNLLIPDAIQYLVEKESRKDKFKDVTRLMAVGIDVPLTRRNVISVQYLRRKYREDWSLQGFRRQTQFFVVQDSLDISRSLPADIMYRDTVMVDRADPLTFYDGLDFFTSHDLTFAWQYRRVKMTEDVLVNPTGRSLTAFYRYLKSTVTDSLADQTSPDGIPRDPLAADSRPLTVNEYVGAYTERLGLPYNNTLSLQVIGAYRNLRLKPGFDRDGGLFEGRFYWPLRYYLGGRNFLSGYPYFTASGSKLFYGRLTYSFPVFRRMNLRFLNLTFGKLYAHMFAETGAVGNFEEAHFSDLSTDDFLSDVGGELRMEMFTNYRIPLRAFFQVAHPLNRQRVQRREAREEGVSLDSPDAPELIDRWRYYFGLGFFPQDLLGVGRHITQPLFSR